MPIFQKLVNFDTMFHQLSETPIIVNDLVDDSEEDKENIKNLITTRYSSDMITLIPSCRCGIVKGEFSIGVVCEYCNTTVKSAIEDEIEPNIWFRKPNGVDALINPIIWIMLKKRFTRSGFNIIQWLTDTSYKPTVKQPAVMSKVIQSGIQRGYNNFVLNFDTIMSFLFSLKEFKLKKGIVDYLRPLIEQNRDCVFSDYIPLINKSLLIIEKVNVGVFVDPIVIKAVDAIHMLVSIDMSFHDQTRGVKENRTAKAISKLSDFYEQFYKRNLAPKSGHLRKHIYGSRTNFSFRAVISSITNTHVYDEIYVPWGIGLTAFRLHLINKLLHMGWDLNSSIGMILGHVHKYHPLLDKLLQELITEAGGGNGIYCLNQRNPSLLQGSSQRVRITRFKTDPRDFTVSIGILTVNAMNADFDGDCTNFIIAIDNTMAEMWYPLEPKFNIFQLDRPDQISRNIAIPKPNISAVSRYLAE